MAVITELTTRVMLMVVVEMVIVNRGNVRPMMRGGGVGGGGVENGGYNANASPQQGGLSG